MKHARDDYNRIQDPALHDPSLLATGTRPIAEDEPVFLLRASDAAAPGAVRCWALEASVHHGASDGIVEMALAWADRMEEWQRANGAKVPDLPAASTREESDAG